MNTKEKKREYARNHYQKNKQQYIDRAKRNTARYKQWYSDLKETLSCSFCKEDDSCCLEFHHPNDDKEHHVSDMRGKFSKKKILEEIAKCVVLCANCHRKVHAGKIDIALLVKPDIT